MKNLKKILFSRSTFIIIALILQLILILGIIIKFQEYFVEFYVVSMAISLIALLLILNKNINPTYKIAWIIPILVFPLFGGIFYFYFGGNRVNMKTMVKMNYIDTKTRESLAEYGDLIPRLEDENLTASNQSIYIKNYSGYPPFKNTFSEYLPSGEVKFQRLKEELEKAEEFIFLEYFIIGKGIMWNSILKILKEKVKQGIEVRIIYDDLGCMNKLPLGYDKELEKIGIKCAVFNHIIPFLSSRLNNRDHRKIAVIDGHTAFTGGINLADEYINMYEKYGHWKDTAIMLKGAAVCSFTVMFLTMWGFIKGIDEDFHMYLPDEKRTNYINSEYIGKGYIQPYADTPLDNEAVGETVYSNLINKANKYVYITTPYLIIDYDMTKSLISSAKSGVDVRIITPHKPDKWYVHEVTKSSYKSLIDGGVRIFEYTPGFIHSKTFVSDDAYGVVGTINMDYRSLYFHYECGVWMYRTESVMDVKKDFLKTQEKCKEIKAEDLKLISFPRTLLGAALKVFAPMM